MYYKHLEDEFLKEHKKFKDTFKKNIDPDTYREIFLAGAQAACNSFQPDSPLDKDGRVIEPFRANGQEYYRYEDLIQAIVNGGRNLLDTLQNILDNKKI